MGQHTYFPFGLEATSPAQDGERMKLTGHERDTRGTPTVQTDDLDYMHARFYNPNIARFASVDAERDSNPVVPQSWNLYAYVRNNPINITDPDGKAVVEIKTANADLFRNELERALTTVLGANAAGTFASLLSPKPPDPTTDALGLAGPLVITTTAAVKGGVQILANAAKGKAAKALAARQLVSEGNRVIGSRVAANTSLGRRVIDHLIQTPAGELGAVEVKSGGSGYRGMQVAKDTEMATAGAVLVGKNAPSDLKLQLQIIITTLLRIP